VCNKSNKCAGAPGSKEKHCDGTRSSSPSNNGTRHSHGFSNESGCVDGRKRLHSGTLSRKCVDASDDVVEPARDASSSYRSLSQPKFLDRPRKHCSVLLQFEQTFCEHKHQPPCLPASHATSLSRSRSRPMRRSSMKCKVLPRAKRPRRHPKRSPTTSS
jgi:hypothetical protein